MKAEDLVFFIPHQVADHEEVKSPLKGVLLGKPFFIPGHLPPWAHLKVIGDKAMIEFQVRLTTLLQIGRMDELSHDGLTGVMIGEFRQPEIQLVGDSKEFFGINATDLGFPKTFELIARHGDTSIRLYLDSPKYREAVEKLIELSVKSLVPV